ncbi:competence type IV pilus minor pilin ComGF [Lactobacillaceae bacterium Scapto_B20]
MNKLFCNYNKQLPAFTIVESIISLALVSMSLLLISVVVKAIGQQQATENELTNFHLYLRTIESPKYKFNYVDHRQNQLKLTSNNKVYLINLTNAGIRMTTDKGGYVPLLDRVQRVSWQYESTYLTTQIEMENGTSFKAVSFIESRKDHK